MAAAAAAPGVGEGPAALPAQPLELKSQFRTREGSYRLLGPEPRPRAGPVAAPGPSPPAAGPGPAAAAAPGPAALPPVRLSMVRLALPPAEEPGSPAERSRVCFNLGRELYFYGGAGSGGRGSRRSLDLHKPIDKRIYKGTQPTCHDFNQFTAAADTIALLVGFSAGQVQYLDLVKKDTSKLFNEERLIDKTKVTFVKWLPETERLFLASHASGHLYLYDAEQPCGGATAPQYNLLTQGEGFSVFACKSKTPRNPLLKWVVGEGALNEFAFSPDGRSLACVSQDGCLRVFHFDSMLLQGMMKSYFGGLLCVCWSPDGRYVVTGGEDDLVTVWSFAEGRVVARGHGHKSWVNAVAFDPFTGAAQSPQSAQLSGGGEEEEEPPDPLVRRSPAVTYRFGSAGQDTQFCLWDLTEDVLYPRPPLSRARTLTASGDATVPVPGLPRSLSRSNSLPQPAGTGSARGPPPDAPPAFSVGRFATLTLQERKGPSGTEKEHKRYHSLGNISRSGEKNPGGTGSRGRLDTAKVLGTALCPRIHEVPLLEPLVCKKIAHERLTVLLFLEDCIVTACQEGLICTWARPGKAGLSSQNGGSPSGTVV